MNAIQRARELNAQPLPGCLDRAKAAALLAERALIFSDTRVFVADEHLARMAAFVAAMETVAALPGWRAAVLDGTPETARHETGASGIFFGYDFHIDEQGPKLIEINTNAGGGLLNLQLLAAQCGDTQGLADVAEVERRMTAMFVTEWQAAGRSAAPSLIAIVDEAPEAQYLYPDFLACREVLDKYGLATTVCDSAHLRYEAGELRCGGRRVDMVYNRLTDFFLIAPEHSALRDAWLADAAVITPNPRNYALYADKRHMVLLSDQAWLASIGVAAEVRELIRRVVPDTELVCAANADAMHARRKHLFFKPATGYGAKAGYRGQSVTQRVFADIIAAGDYVAQTMVPPATRVVLVDGAVTELKYDLRCYAYRSEVLLNAARLWQGQMTNFRTPGGGFTPVVRVS